MLFISKFFLFQGCYVLIIGVFSGFGWEIVLYLVEQGFQVIVGVCCQEDGECLVNVCLFGWISMLLIDVIDEEFIGWVVVQVVEKVGDIGFWGLVNNVGICIFVLLECVFSDLLWCQLEVNLIGQFVVIWVILLLLCCGGVVCLVNVILGFGLVVIFYLGVYFVVQFVKEGVSDVLCCELVFMGIQVLVVSFGVIWMLIWGKIVSEGECVLVDVFDVVVDFYCDIYLCFFQVNEDGVCNSVIKFVDVVVVVYVVFIVVKLWICYWVGVDVCCGILLVWLLFDSVIDGMFCFIVIVVLVVKEE